MQWRSCGVGSCTQRWGGASELERLRRRLCCWCAPAHKPGTLGHCWFYLVLGDSGNTDVVDASGVLMLQYIPNTCLFYWSLQVQSVMAMCASNLMCMLHTCQSSVHKPVVVYMQGAGTSS